MSGKFTLLLAEVQPFEQHYARCDEERERDHDGPDSFLFRCERDAWWHGCDCLSGYRVTSVSDRACSYSPTRSSSVNANRKRRFDGQRSTSTREVARAKPPTHTHAKTRTRARVRVAGRLICRIE